jgi:hypothetical protein
MSANLIELFKESIGDTLTRQASQLLGESAENTSAAIMAILSTLSGALSVKGSTEQGARDLMNFTSTQRIDEVISQDLPSMLTGDAQTEKLTEEGGVYAGYLLGSKLSQVIDAIAANNGLKTSSASTLVKIMTPIVMGVFARTAKERSLDVSGFRDLLLSQRDAVLLSLPSYMKPVLQEPVAQPYKPTSISDMPAPSTETTTLSKLLPWIVLLIAALGLFYFLNKGSQPDPAQLEKKLHDSLENVRQMDSLNNARMMDSVGNATTTDTVSPAGSTDTISN